MKYFGYVMVFTLLVCCVGCPGLLTGNTDHTDDGHDDAHEAEFSYGGDTGPSNWGSLSEQWSACRDGIEQSPVDIAGATENASLPALDLNYQVTTANLLNNGHTWQVNYDAGSTLTYMGETYELLQFHFHTPAEHPVSGTRAAMELHLVHQNAAGDLAVIGVLINAGQENAFLAQFWDDIPRQEGEVEEDYQLNVAEIMPADLSYYTYAGSLTTPPCSEIVTWIVLKTPVEASQAQIDAMNNNLGDNARPLQALNGRTIEHR